MGIDWFRVGVRRETDPAQLGRLMEQQALAFQSIGTWNSKACTDRVRDALCHRLHFETYLAASDSVRGLLEFPGWDDERQRATDLPDLVPCWRVYPITYNPTFPPLWRMRAHRTFLPDQLRAQLLVWKAWAAQVANGEHDAYLRELHLHETSDFMRHHWSFLRAAATESLTRTASWAHKPALVEVRERVLRLPEPTVSSVPIEPTEKRSVKPEEFDAHYAAVFEEARTLIALTRAWDANVRGNRKLRYYEGYYHLTLDGFRARARDPWLQEFFAWATRCVQQGFGFYLDS